MIANDGNANALAKGWPSGGYPVTVISTGEEPQLEGPINPCDSVQSYPVNALAKTGAHGGTVSVTQAVLAPLHLFGANPLLFLARKIAYGR